MPTMHFTYPGPPAEALGALRTAALEKGWTPDPGACGPLLLAIKLGANEHTYGWSANISVVSAGEDHTSLVATTDDMNHDSEYRRAKREFKALVKAVGARRG